MKKIVLIIGGLFLVLNTLAGLIASSYQPINFLMADLSIILTFAIFYWITVSGLSVALKIGFICLFIITGIIRLVCMIVMPPEWEDNYFLIIFAAIFFLELGSLAIYWHVNKKARGA